MLSAAVGLFGGALAPFVYWSVNMWEMMHPTTSVIPSLPASMRGPFLWCVVAFFALTGALVIVRLRLELSRSALERAHVMLEE